MSKGIDLVYGGTKIREQSDSLSLTDLWKAAGADPSRKPAEWLRSVDAQRFVEFLAETLNLSAPQDGTTEVGIGGTEVGISHFGLVRVKKGGSNGGDTWAHWQIGMAYAKYLSPEFHAWCNSVVRAHMEGQAIIGHHAIKAAMLRVQQMNTANRLLGRINQIAGTRAAAKAMPAILGGLGIHIDIDDSPAMRQGKLPLDGE